MKKLLLILIFVLQSCDSLPPLMLEDKWAQNCSRDYGLKKGTVAYGDCVNNFRIQNQKNIQQMMNNNQLINNLLNQGQRRTLNNNTYVAPGVNRGRLTNQIISGQNRICYYSLLGSTSVVTVQKHEICP